jgi:hypothetical protein
MDPDGDPIREYFTLESYDEIDAYHFQMLGPALLHPSIMMRRDDVLAVGGYRPFHVEDIDLYLRMGERGKLGRVPEFLLKYRLHGNNISPSNSGSRAGTLWRPAMCARRENTLERRWPGNPCRPRLGF